MLDRLTFRLFRSFALDAVLCRIMNYCAKFICFIFFHILIWLSGRQDQAQVWNARILSGAQWKTLVSLLQIQRPTTERFPSFGDALQYYCETDTVWSGHSMIYDISLNFPQLFGSAACWIATVFTNECKQTGIICLYIYILILYVLDSLMLDWHDPLMLDHHTMTSMMPISTLRNICCTLHSILYPPEKYRNREPNSIFRTLWEYVYTYMGYHMYIYIYILYVLHEHV